MQPANTNNPAPDTPENSPQQPFQPFDSSNLQEPFAPQPQPGTQPPQGPQTSFWARHKFVLIGVGVALVLAIGLLVYLYQAAGSSAQSFRSALDDYANALNDAGSDSDKLAELHHEQPVLKESFLGNLNPEYAQAAAKEEAMNRQRQWLNTALQHADDEETFRKNIQDRFSTYREALFIKLKAPTTSGAGFETYKKDYVTYTDKMLQQTRDYRRTIEALGADEYTQPVKDFYLVEIDKSSRAYEESLKEIKAAKTIGGVNRAAAVGDFRHTESGYRLSYPTYVTTALYETAPQFQLAAANAIVATNEDELLSTSDPTVSADVTYYAQLAAVFTPSDKDGNATTAQKLAVMHYALASMERMVSGSNLDDSTKEEKLASIARAQDLIDVARFGEYPHMSLLGRALRVSGMASESFSSYTNYKLRNSSSEGAEVPPLETKETRALITDSFKLMLPKNGYSDDAVKDYKEALLTCTDKRIDFQEESTKLLTAAENDGKRLEEIQKKLENEPDQEIEEMQKLAEEALEIHDRNVQYGVKIKKLSADHERDFKTCLPELNKTQDTLIKVAQDRTKHYKAIADAVAKL